MRIWSQIEAQVRKHARACPHTIALAHPHILAFPSLRPLQAPNLLLLYSLACDSPKFSAIVAQAGLVPLIVATAQIALSDVAIASPGDRCNDPQDVLLSALSVLEHVAGTKPGRSALAGEAA